MPKLHHRISLILAVAYLFALACIAFWPTPVDRPISGTLTQVIGWLHEHGMPWYIGYNKIEFAANIALFAPLGYVIASAWARKWWHVALIGGSVSFLMELGQALLLPARYASALDILANTLGAALGAGILVVVHRLPTRRTTAGRHRGHPGA